MSERPGTGGESEKGGKKLDLSLPQVAGSAVAAVVAAKLASYFGVYGTILGAGIVSVIATCGGTLFQHFFKRTGEQIREAAVPDRARQQAPPPPGEFTEGTVYRARVGNRKRPVVAAVLVFGLTLAGITAYELASGNSFSGGRGTTVSDALGGRSSSSKSGGGEPTSSPSPTRSSAGGVTPSSGTPSQSDDESNDAGDDAAETSGTTSSPTPHPSATDTTGADSDAATPTPGPPTTSPTPSASSRSGTDAQDPADPATR